MSRNRASKPLSDFVEPAAPEAPAMEDAPVGEPPHEALAADHEPAIDRATVPMVWTPPELRAELRAEGLEDAKTRVGAILDAFDVKLRDGGALTLGDLRAIQAQIRALKPRVA